MSVDWGTVPEWIGGIGTLLAFGVALRLLFLELRARRATESDNRARDARRISAWWEWDDEIATGAGPVPRDRAGLPRGWVIRLRNAGDTPVYDCQVYLGGPRTRGKQPMRFDLPVVPPETTLWEGFGTEDVFDPSDEDYETKTAWVELVFTDSAGKRWLRKWYGELTEVDTPNPPIVGRTDC